MALRTGGLSGIEKLINSAALGTIELSTGLQISGVFQCDRARWQTNLQTTGKTALASREKLVGHGTLTHPDGFEAL
jgi:phenylalanine-4-hydroxylase